MKFCPDCKSLLVRTGKNGYHKICNRCGTEWKFKKVHHNKTGIKAWRFTFKE